MCLTTKKQTLGLAATIFSVASVVHALRLVNQWPAVIGGWSVPMWFSVLAVLLAGYLGWELFKLSRVEKK